MEFVLVGVSYQKSTPTEIGISIIVEVSSHIKKGDIGVNTGLGFTVTITGVLETSEQPLRFAAA